MNRITILLVTLLALVVVACGGPEQATPTETATATPTPTPEPTEEPTATADPTSDATDDGFGSEPNELADVLPTEVEGIAIEYEYATGPDFEDGEEMDDDAREFLERVGGDIDQMTSAFGFGLDAEAGGFITIIAFRIPGADEQAMLEEFRASIADEESGFEFADETIDGKSVVAASSAEQGTTYLYADDDTLFAIGGTTPELAQAALSQIP